MKEAELLLCIGVGLGLSAACGLRVFLPMFALSLAAQSGHLSLTPGFSWLGSPQALTVFAIATVAEVAAYYIPWADNLMDTVAIPAAAVAGTIATAAAVGEMSPWLKWSLATIAGGGVATATQLATTKLRGLSTLTTGGAANPAIATAEAGGSAAVSGIALVVPILGIVLVVAGIVALVAWLLKRRAARANRDVQVVETGPPKQ